MVATSAQYDLPLPSIASAFLNPYAWTLIVVLLVSIITGWNRWYADDPEHVPAPGV